MIEKIIPWLNGILHGMWWFIRNFIHPFLTPIFAFYNYEYLKKNLTPWLANLLLIISIIYGLLTFGIAIYTVIKNINNPPSIS